MPQVVEEATTTTEEYAMHLAPDQISGLGAASGLGFSWVSWGSQMYNSHEGVSDHKLVQAFLLFCALRPPFVGGFLGKFGPPKHRSQTPNPKP